MYLPAFLFDIFCSRVAREFITGSLSSPDTYAKKYSEDLGDEYELVSEALYIGAATEIVQFLSEIEAGEDAVYYLDCFAYNRLYFSNINVERKMKPLFDQGRIYIAQPPLYKIKKGKSEKYIANDFELNRFLTSSFFDNNNLLSDNKPVSVTDSQSVLLNYSMIDNILKKVSKTKDKYILKSMAFIKPINTDDTNQTENLDDLSEYLNSLSKLVNIISPINFRYDLALNELDDNSFEIKNKAIFIF